MWYEEKVINGVLHYRGTPSGEWTPMTKEMLTGVILQLRARMGLTMEYEEEEESNGVL